MDVGVNHSWHHELARVKKEMLIYLFQMSPFCIVLLQYTSVCHGYHMHQRSEYVYYINISLRDSIGIGVEPYLPRGHVVDVRVSEAILCLQVV